MLDVMMRRSKALASLAVMSLAAPAGAFWIPGQVATSWSSAAITSSLAFKAAITAEAQARSNDAIVRDLRSRIARLGGQLRAERGTSTGLRSELRQLQDRLVARLGETDPEYAVKRDEFVRSVGNLLAVQDPRIPALLERYADGDTKALDELREVIGQSPSTPERLVSEQAFATLVLDAWRRQERDTKDAIASYESLARQQPNDAYAWAQLSSLYQFAQEPARAQAALQQLQRTARSPETKAFALRAAGNAAYNRGDYVVARDQLRLSSESYRRLASISFSAWQQAYPRATEPEWVVIGGRREWLAAVLRNLAEAHSALGEHEASVQVARESLNLRKANAVAAQRAGSRSIGELQLASMSAHSLGEFLIQAHSYSEAIAVLEEAIAMDTKAEQLANARDPKREPDDGPIETSILLARAAIRAGNLTKAETVLNGVRTMIGRTKPRVWVVGCEGLFWWETGNLALARGAKRDALQHWTRAEETLARAAALEPLGGWPRHLADLRRGLAGARSST
jgi:tetratricopeptide (TPR) repeat protein